MIRKPKSKKTAKRKSLRKNPEPSIRDIKNWMMDYIKNNPNYDPRPMAAKAIKYFGISVNDDYDNWVQDLAFNIADEFEYNKKRNAQRKASPKTKGFPLGLGNSLFKKKNPDGQIKPRQITLDEIKSWMLRYIKANDDYDPRDMADHAIIHLNIINVTPSDRKTIINFAYKVADEYEMSRKI